MAMELIETVELASSASSIEFTSIPQDGVDLLILISGRDSAGTTGPTITLRLNSSTSGYLERRIVGTGSSVLSSTSTGTLLGVGYIVGNTATASTFGNTAISIANYTSSDAKSVSSDSVTENNATESWQTIVAGSWSGTDAITSIQLFAGAASFASGSTASLYKIS
jgi:hypothetical protein